MSVVTLRPYQAEGTNQLRIAYGSGKRALLFVMGCGGGKTVCFAFITHGAAAKCKRVLIVAHRRELIRQASRKLSEAGVEHGIIAPGFTPTRDAVQVASIQTLANRLEKVGNFDLIVIDEAHHSVAGTYVKLIASQPQAKLLGVTATAERLDGRGLGLHVGGCFDDIVLGPQPDELIAGGYLKPIKVFAPATGPDLSGVKVRMGDYERGALADAMGAPTITGCAIEHYARHTPGWPAVAFCVSVDHAKSVAATFRAAGWRAASADGSMSSADRDAAFAGLTNGSIQVLTVCDICGEGLDIPGISAVIILRATRSLTNFIQWVGRGNRPIYAPGYDMSTDDGRKAAIAASPYPHLVVLDHAGCTLNHGMPDERRAWSLNGRPKRNAAPPTRQCPKCFAIHRPASKCPECGHSYEAEIKAAREMEVVAGQLAEIDAARMAAIRSGRLHDVMQAAKTKDDFREIAKLRGYHQGWVRHAMRERGV